ncbi:MAG: haloacid dehalogenase [Anaerolineales bacterium]|nr:haloacid dehalogenase [Anaerolineales bacterium]
MTTSSLENLESIAEGIRQRFEEIDGVREFAYKQSRDVIRTCANAIRAIHREDWDTADELRQEAHAQVRALHQATADYAQIYYSGYTQDCLKEYVEMEHTYALVRQRPLLDPQTLNVEEAVWINGLAEAATELRRRILDIIRHDHQQEAERLLSNMDEIYSELVTFDFRDAITGGLRRRTDTVRAVLERTRGDVTTSLRQAQLEKALANLEKKVQEGAE